MSWAFGLSGEGREIGYGVLATCAEGGCTAAIDCGLSYVCGSMHDGGELGCGDYFCGRHLYGGGPEQLCRACSDLYEAAHPEDDADHQATCEHCQAEAAKSERFMAYIRQIRAAAAEPR